MVQVAHRVVASHEGQDRVEVMHLGDATVMAADGLLKYGRRDRIAVLARGEDLQVAVQQLAELPRLRSGALPDDVGIILCRS